MSLHRRINGALQLVGFRYPFSALFQAHALNAHVFIWERISWNSETAVSIPLTPNTKRRFLDAGRRLESAGNVKLTQICHVRIMRAQFEIDADLSCAHYVRYLFILCHVLFDRSLR